MPSHLTTFCRTTITSILNRLRYVLTYIRLLFRTDVLSQWLFFVERYPFSRACGNPRVKSSKPYGSSYQVNHIFFTEFHLTQPTFLLLQRSRPKGTCWTQSRELIHYHSGWGEPLLPNINCWLLVLIMRSKFYSWYIYHDNEADEGRSISSAEYVEDVNSDSVVIVDGLTKVLLLHSSVNKRFKHSHRTGGSLGGGFVGLSVPRILSPPCLNPVCLSMWQL